MRLDAALRWLRIHARFAPVASFSQANSKIGVSMTCSDIEFFAAGIESGSDDCTAITTWGLGCCPPKAENPCILCPNGVVSDGEIHVGEFSMTCSDFSSYAMGFETSSYECTDCLGYLGIDCCSIPDEMPQLLPPRLQQLPQLLLLLSRKPAPRRLPLPAPRVLVRHREASPFFLILVVLRSSPSLLPCGLKQCSHEGCTNQVQKKGVCITHGARLK